MVRGTLNPRWEGAVFEVAAPEDPLSAELVVDVYDFDDAGAHDFLGKVIERNAVGWGGGGSRVLDTM